MEITSTQFAAAPPVTLPVRVEAAGAQNREVARAARELNEEGVAGSGREFSIAVDPKTKLAVVRIVDANTRELIDQFPSAYIVEMARQLKQLFSSNPETDR